jgi:hypothetical protein
MQEYLRAKPKGKFGAHRYEVDDARSRERPMFRRYQSLYGVPSEI